MKDSELVSWATDRLVHVHGEKEGADFVRRLRTIPAKIEAMEKAQKSKVPLTPHVFAQMVNRVRDLAFDFGTTEQFRDRVSELLGEYVDDRLPEQKDTGESGPVPDYTGEGSAWVPPVEERGIVGGLLPCPFCGDPSVYQLDARHASAGTPTIACRKCGARMFTSDPKDWNTRAP